MKLRFNVVFTPGTCRYLQLGVLTLLRHSDFSYRLVGNGISDEEATILEQLAGSFDRVDFLRLSEASVVEHGIALSQLFELEESSLFAFMDSDIFATGQFANELESSMQGFDVFSSCSCPLWDKRDVSKGFVGRSTHTPSGHRLPGSFLAVYRTSSLRKLMTRHDIGFQRYTSDSVPRDLKRVCRMFGWDGQLLDTGKLLNLMAIHDGQTISHVELDKLVHLGGISSWIMHWSHREDETETFTLDDAKVVSNSRTRTTNTLDGDLRFRQRIEAAGYFAAYLRWLFNDGKKPTLAVEDEHTRMKICLLEEQMSEIFGAYSRGVL